MNLACEEISGIFEATKKLIEYESIFEKWLTGEPYQDVQYNGITIPTLRKLIATIDERESHAAQEVIDEGIAQIVAIRNTMMALEQKVRDEIAKMVGMDVLVTMLPEGGSASGAYDNETGVLSLQIPRGFTGEMGPAGPQGQAPVIDVINCGKAKTEWITVIDGGHAAYPA